MVGMPLVLTLAALAFYASLVLFPFAFAAVAAAFSSFVVFAAADAAATVVASSMFCQLRQLMLPFVL